MTKIVKISIILMVLSGFVLTSVSSVFAGNICSGGICESDSGDQDGGIAELLGE